MALTGCNAILKYIVVGVNLVLWLTGLLVVGLLIWMLTDPPIAYIQVIQHDEGIHYIFIYLFLLGIGALMFIVSFLGCSGAYWESQCMLVWYFCFLLIILVADIVAGTWVLGECQKMEEVIKNTVITTVQKDYGVISSRTIVFDAVQQQLKCCGATGPSDWSKSVYSNRSNNNDEGLISMILRSYNISSTPASCYTDGSCDSKIQTVVAFICLFKEGCVSKLIDFFEENAYIVIRVSLVVGILDILGLVFSVILYYAIRAIDRYKA